MFFKKKNEKRKALPQKRALFPTNLNYVIGQSTTLFYRKAKIGVLWTRRKQEISENKPPPAR
jgi:hypothetical protein